MKLSGEGQAEIIKLAVMLAVGAFAIYYAKNAVNGAMTSAKQGISDSIDSVLSLPGKAVDTVVSGAGSMWDSTKKFFSPPASHQQAATYNEPWDPGTGVDW